MSPVFLKASSNFIPAIRLLSSARSVLAPAAAALNLSCLAAVRNFEAAAAFIDSSKARSSAAMSSAADLSFFSIAASIRSHAGPTARMWLLTLSSVSTSFAAVVAPRALPDRPGQHVGRVPDVRGVFEALELREEELRLEALVIGVFQDLHVWSVVSTVAAATPMRIGPFAPFTVTMVTRHLVFAMLETAGTVDMHSHSGGARSASRSFSPSAFSILLRDSLESLGGAS